MPTFAEAAATVVEQKRAGWRSPRQAVDWLHSLQRYALPHIGSRPVSEVGSADVLAVLTPICHVGPDTARRLRQRISAVLEWSIAMEHRTDNPCDRIGPVLGPQRDVVRHMRALPHRDVAAEIGTVRASRSTRAVKLAFEFLALTARDPGSCGWRRGTRSTPPAECGPPRPSQPVPCDRFLGPECGRRRKLC